MFRLPKATVVVPVYNVEKYLQKCVDSILAQTEPDFELLLVDDGSTDGSGGLCDKLSERDGASGSSTRKTRAWAAPGTRASRPP